MVDYIGEISKVTGSLYSLVGWGLMLVIVAVIIMVVVIIMQYKHKVRVRCVVGGKTIIIDDRAKEIKDNEGVTKWKLFKRKHHLPPPPQEAIHITNKGKYSVEAYYLPEGEYKYVLDNGVIKSNLSNFEPLDTADREFYASEMKEAESYKKKNWKDMVLPLAGIISIMMIFILMLVFWEDIAKPGITITQTSAGVAEIQYETMKIARDIIQNRQTVPDLDILLPERNSSG